jgi:hypothetical protein
MRSILLTGVLACGAACAQTTGAPGAAGDGPGWTVYSDISVWQASDAVPLSQVEDDWTGYSPRSGRNTFLMRNRVAAGVEKNRWRLGLEMRQDAYITTDRETLDAYYLVQQQQKPALGAGYRLQGHYFSWRAHGLRIGHTLDGPRIAGRTSTIELSGAVYGKQRLRERSVNGTLTYPQADTYVLNASHVDTNSRMTNRFMGEAPSASGASLSVAVTVPLADAWTLRVQADDIASRLRWKNLPVYAESQSLSARSDANGDFRFQRDLNGQNRQVERSFKIPRYTAAALDYRYENWGAAVHVARYAGETIPTLSLSHRFGWLTLRGNVETRFDTAGIGLEAGNFRFLLQSDDLDLNEAKARSLQLHYHRSF